MEVSDAGKGRVGVSVASPEIPVSDSFCGLIDSESSKSLEGLGIWTQKLDAISCKVSSIHSAVAK